MSSKADVPCICNADRWVFGLELDVKSDMDRCPELFFFNLPSGPAGTASEK